MNIRLQKCVAVPVASIFLACSVHRVHQHDCAVCMSYLLIRCGLERQAMPRNTDSSCSSRLRPGRQLRQLPPSLLPAPGLEFSPICMIFASDWPGFLTKTTAWKVGRKLGQLLPTIYHIYSYPAFAYSWPRLSCQTVCTKVTHVLTKKREKVGPIQQGREATILPRNAITNKSLWPKMWDSFLSSCFMACVIYKRSGDKKWNCSYSRILI